MIATLAWSPSRVVEKVVGHAVHDIEWLVVVCHAQHHLPLSGGTVKSQLTSQAPALHRPVKRSRFFAKTRYPRSSPCEWELLPSRLQQTGSLETLGIFRQCQPLAADPRPTRSWRATTKNICTETGVSTNFLSSRCCTCWRRMSAQDRLLLSIDVACSFSREATTAVVVLPMSQGLWQASPALWEPPPHSPVSFHRLGSQLRISGSAKVNSQRSSSPTEAFTTTWDSVRFYGSRNSR